MREPGTHIYSLRHTIVLNSLCTLPSIMMLVYQFLMKVKFRMLFVISQLLPFIHQSTTQNLQVISLAQFQFSPSSISYKYLIFHMIKLYLLQDIECDVLYFVFRSYQPGNTRRFHLPFSQLQLTDTFLCLCEDEIRP